MVAAIYQLMTQQDANCYFVEFENSRRTKMCNVAQQVLVAFAIDSSDDEPDSLFIATVTSTASQTEGNFICNDPLKDSISSHFKNTVRAKFASSTGRKEEEVGARVHCVEDKCVRPKEWRKCVDDFSRGGDTDKALELPGSEIATSSMEEAD